MSRTMYGYVELYTYQKWELIFATDTFLIGGTTALMYRLFGVVEQEKPPISSHRERPSDASSEICFMYDHYVQSGEMVNAGWALFSELEPYADEIINDETEGWRILYRMMEPLAAHFGGDRVRFTAWQLI